jgi:hypothetical protein
LFASGNRAETIARVRELLDLAAPAVVVDPPVAQTLAHPCPAAAAA